MSNQKAIEISALKKNYGELKVLKGIDLSILRGEVFALLGPNGAGKTTTIEILEGHRNKSSGEISVLGFDPEKNSTDFRRKVGIVLQETGVEQYLTVSEVLTQFSGFYENPISIKRLLEITGLNKFKDQKVKRLSGGQRRRLDVAIGLSGNPELLFLDEPTTGFDPSARRDSWEMIHNLRELGKTILLTTHYMDEAEYLSDRIGLMFEGTIKSVGTLNELRNENNTSTITFQSTEDLTKLPNHILRTLDKKSNFYSIETEIPNSILLDLLHWASKEKIQLNELSVTPKSLEDIFLEIAREINEIN
tara:strand:+ start:1075 stop:1989 length:915 start_codon:yes stop_codon:yes gene_type:complete